MIKVSSKFSCLFFFKSNGYLLSFFLIFSAEYIGAQNITDTIYREENVYRLVDQIEDDNTLQLEWLTTLYFHKQLNDYRNSKGVKSVHWDHKLWMAARNHNIYLLRDVKHLSHSQIKSKSFFTGNQPQNRVDYVVYNSNEFKIAGFENCYGISPLSRMYNYKAEINEMKKIAKLKAQEAFEAWQNSSRHNQNMLDTEHITHGTSIIFGGFGIHATSIFARKQKYYEPDTIFLPFLASFVDKNDFLITPNYHDFSAPENEMKILNYKYFYLATQFFKDKKISSNKALYKMTQSDIIPKDQKTRNKYYRKERGIKGYIELLTHEPKYFGTTFKMSFNEFKKLKGADEFRKIIQSQLNNVNTKIKGGAGIIKSTKTAKGVRVEVRIALLVKK